jgi:CRP-like cAMP-binding protein
LKALPEQLDAHFLRHFTLSVKRYLYREGEINHDTYVLRKGWILLTRTLKDGKRQVFRSVLPGEFFGFQPDLQGPSICSAITLTDCVICVVPNLVKLCRLQPELALRLAWIGACDMALMEMYLASIAQRNARERIAFMALELYRRLKLRGLNRDYTIQFPLLQEDIADALGLTTVHVNRTLHSLREDKLLKIEKHELTILDYDALFYLVGSYLEPMNSCDFSNNTEQYA